MVISGDWPEEKGRERGKKEREREEMKEREKEKRKRRERKMKESGEEKKGERKDKFGGCSNFRVLKPEFIVFSIFQKKIVLRQNFDF